jgi:hypothetical protein
MAAIVTSKLCRLVKELQFYVVASNQCSVNSVITPDPMPIHFSGTIIPFFRHHVTTWFTAVRIFGFMKATFSVYHAQRFVYISRP